MEVSGPAPRVKETSSKSLFEDCDDFGWKSKLLIAKGINFDLLFL